MMAVGLTGGIGAGKSTVAEMLQARGAVVVDADHLARQAIEPGTPEFVKLVDYFGPRVLTPQGEVDRPALAARVFADETARRALEAIIHPAVGRLFAEAARPYRDTDQIVVYVIPLLVENHLEGMFDVVVVVWAPEDVRVERVMAARAMPAGEVRRRMAAQATDEERARVSDVVLPNDGSPRDLERRVEQLWAELTRRSVSSGR